MTCAEPRPRTGALPFVGFGRRVNLFSDRQGARRWRNISLYCRLHKAESLGGARDASVDVCCRIADEKTEGLAPMSMLVSSFVLTATLLSGSWTGMEGAGARAGDRVAPIILVQAGTQNAPRDGGRSASIGTDDTAPRAAKPRRRPSPAAAGAPVESYHLNCASPSGLAGCVGRALNNELRGFRYR